MPIDIESTQLLIDEIASVVATLELFSPRELADPSGRTASTAFNRLRERAVDLFDAEVDPGQTMSASSRSDLLASHKRLLLKIESKSGLKPTEIEVPESTVEQIVNAVRKDYFLMKRSNAIGSGVVTLGCILSFFGVGLWGIFNPIETQKITVAESKSIEVLEKLQTLEAEASKSVNHIKQLALDAESGATDGVIANVSEAP